jgi:hypothetical protein
MKLSIEKRESPPGAEPDMRLLVRLAPETLKEMADLEWAREQGLRPVDEVLHRTTYGNDPFEYVIMLEARRRG